MFFFQKMKMEKTLKNNRNLTRIYRKRWNEHEKKKRELNRNEEREKQKKNNFVQTSSCLCGRRGILVVFFCIFVSRFMETQRMEHDSSAGGVGVEVCPRATPQVCPVATSTEGREAPATTSGRSDTAGLLAAGAPPGSHRHQRQRSGRHTQRRR